MAKRILIWLTDEEVKKYEERVKEWGVEYVQLATLLVCRELGVSIPDKKKKRAKWLRDHEEATRGEFRVKGGDTEQRVEKIMRDENKKVWTTGEIREALGWKKAGALNEILKDSPRFKQTTKPEDWVSQRGRQPNFWKLAK